MNRAAALDGATRLRLINYLPLKRFADVVLSSAALLALWPLLLLISLMIYLDDGGPVLFRQSRAGRWHEPFTIFKFRTMKRSAPNISTEEMRQRGLSPYTRLGPWLRRTSLDELPQLLNVLRGEMSVVGPRPALMSQGPVLTGREAAGAHVLRPGITGFAQVTGRDDLSDEEKVRRDQQYLNGIGPRLDLLILWRTVRGVSSANGAY